MAAPSGAASQETLDRVQRMKKKVESTISNRLRDVNERRMRRLELENRMRRADLDENAKRDLRQDYTQQEREHLRAQRTKIGVKDFALITIIGKGAFGEVRIVRNKRDQAVYAMKTMRKRDMIAKNQSTHIQSERDLMAAADNSLLVKLFYSFQDDTYLYLVMEFCGGGDLMTILMREDILTEEQTMFYMAELSAAINAVHELDFVHRDLKPDNILIANSGHIKLTDFGLAKSFNTENDSLVNKYAQKSHTLTDTTAAQDAQSANNYRQRKGQPARQQREKMFSTVGTPDYIAPEVFSQKGYDKMVDWWSMGVIMFECLVGYPPFYAEDPLQTCRKIVHYRKYFKIPTDANLSRPAIDIIHKLVCSRRRRIGFEAITQHPFFRPVPWENLMEMTPPFEPTLSSDVDSSNFDTIETDQEIDDQQFRPSKATDKSHFVGYTFTRPIDMTAPNIQEMLRQYNNEVENMTGAPPQAEDVEEP